jgi:hypothetical protein
MAANPPSLSEIAALAGSPAHANMLTAPLDGRAASELAYAGGVAPHNTSEHLAKLKAAPAASASARKGWAVRSACRASRLVTRCNFSSSRSWSAMGAERAAHRHTDRASGETARRLNQSSYSIGGKRDAAKGTAASAVR